MIIVTKEEERRRRKKKSNGCTPSFYNSYFGDSFCPKKMFDAKGPLGDNVIKNPARDSVYIYIYIYVNNAKRARFVAV